MNKLLICNCCGDEAIAPISMYLIKEKFSEVTEGVKKAAAAQNADVMYFLPDAVKDDATLREDLEKNGSVHYGKESLVTCNAFAILQELKGNLPRPLIQDGAVPVYEDKEVVLITPEEAYGEATGADTKFVYVISGEKSEVKEVAVGTKASEIAEVSGAKAVLLGGLRGTFLLPSSLADYAVTKEHLYDSLTVYTDKDCMVDVTAKLMNRAWENSCGKCVLCREGSLQFKTIVGEMTQGKAKMTDPDMLREVGELIEVGAYCAYGKNMPRPLISALNLFAGEFEEHIKKKSCSAGVCYKAEAVYVILPDKCTGCGDCMDECDEDAIEGKKGFIHMIDQDMCENCGKCVGACDEEAIVAVTGKLPKLPKKLTKVGKF